MHSKKYKNAEDVEDEPSHSNIYSINISYYDVLVPRSDFVISLIALDGKSLVSKFRRPCPWGRSRVVFHFVLNVVVFRQIVDEEDNHD